MLLANDTKFKIYKVELSSIPFAFSDTNTLSDILLFLPEIAEESSF